ncbi:cupin domain-containing protein [Bacillus salacetis]|uniref:Cupin domain-containing protein n=1 Tax=Bacillus salacetis TaxID=2315464 RepID=A0A3A1QZF4_9BACI|nr:cupin domain-containing protein [Bacillus salacetis]RIW34679.1 cupin domain-containing protein [Bacillus salacetis]
MYNFTPFQDGENSQRIDDYTAEDFTLIIKKNAEVIDLYTNLIQEAPNQLHQRILSDSLQNKRSQLNQFTILHQQRSGVQPHYDIEKIEYEGYTNGIEKAFQAEFENSEEYRNQYYILQDDYIRNTILHAFTAQRENALRLQHLMAESAGRIQDNGGKPYVVDIEKATTENDTYRTALWTGEHMQVTLMSIDVGDDIGLEVHPETDQFIRIEEGQGLVQMGATQNNLTFQEQAFADYAVMIPAGTWHNITNTGSTPMKVYAIYAPPEHPFGTIHETKADAMAAEG